MNYQDVSQVSSAATSLNSCSRTSYSTKIIISVHYLSQSSNITQFIRVNWKINSMFILFLDQARLLLSSTLIWQVRVFSFFYLFDYKTCSKTLLKLRTAICMRFLFISLDDTKLEKQHLGRACKCNRYKNNKKNFNKKSLFRTSNKKYLGQEEQLD